MKKYEVCDYRYDTGLRTRVEKQIMPTITAKGGGVLVVCLWLKKRKRN